MEGRGVFAQTDVVGILRWLSLPGSTERIQTCWLLCWRFQTCWLLCRCCIRPSGLEDIQAQAQAHRLWLSVPGSWCPIGPEAIWRSAVLCVQHGRQGRRVGQRYRWNHNLQTSDKGRRRKTQGQTSVCRLLGLSWTYPSFSNRTLPEGSQSDVLHIYVDASFDTSSYSGLGGLVMNMLGEYLSFFSVKLRKRS